MNSMFSAFKKTEKHQNLHQQNNNQTIPPLSPITDHHQLHSSKSKKMLNVQENTYENLRHIREIGSTNNIILPTATATSPPPSLIANLLATQENCEEINGTDVVDHEHSSIQTEQNFNYTQHCDNTKKLNQKVNQTTTSTTPLVDEDDESTISDSITYSGNCTSSSSELSNNTVKHTQNSDDNDSDLSDVDDNNADNISEQQQQSNQPQSQQQSKPKSPISLLKTTTNNFTEPVILSKTRVCRNEQATTSQTTVQTGAHSASNTPKNIRYGKPRLSLSGFNGSLNSMPSIHGRPNTKSTENGAENNTNGQPKRLSTHQRNLSLDFRSMGILLPPVSQVTNTRINLTQHHRNRSLDSALQRIPEVEVSSPNAETENTFCTNSILGSTMCSKVTGTCQTTSTSASCSQNIPSASSSTATPSSTQYPSECLLDTFVCLKPRENRKTPTTAPSSNSKVPNNPDSSKKKEDLTSLGSDDSGIICGGSESDQVSLNRIRQSHESLDSGEIDAEEECIEILETTSMDEEYRMLQSDLCFYQSSETDYNTLKPLKKSQKKAEENSEPSEEKDDTEETSSQSNLQTVTTPPIAVKNEILFKHFFGATKNAIFRTAQIIIDNHEKKNAAKNQLENVKSPTEISKKKDFFTIKTSNKKNQQELQAPTTPTTPDSEILTEVEVPMAKSSSISSLNKLKVPGVVKCFIKEKDNSTLSSSSATTSQKQISSNNSSSNNSSIINSNKTEKGPSGLLRFFESPVFNIHFAIHYLFYSKEPGVLSFIGNKIFNFPDEEVDLYIPQLIVMYIQMGELAEVLDPYLTLRCKKSVDFSLKCLWLLEAYNYQCDPPTQNRLALMRELFSKKERRKTTFNNIQKKTHHRSQSDATILLNQGSSSLRLQLPPCQLQTKLCLGDLTSGRAFDNGCVCFESVRGTVNDLLGHKTVCVCGAPKTAPQKEFMKALINIGKNLTALPTKAEKTSALRMFLNLINKNLPARVWLPLYTPNCQHHIVRITEEKTAVLNSKDKTPYIIYVEVVEVQDIYTSPVILKMMPTLRHTKSEENLESKDTLKKGATSTSESSNVSNILEIPSIVTDDVWSQEDDEITAQYLNLKLKMQSDRGDTISQMSMDSCDSRDQGLPTFFNIGDVRVRHCSNLNCENTKSFSNDPEDPSAAALKEPWDEKEKQIRESSPYGHLSNWKLLSCIVKCGDDLRQELMATQILEMFKLIWEEEKVDLWVRPYKIVCLSDDSGLIEPILNTVSLHQIKKNSNKSLRDYFIDEYGGDDQNERFKTAQKNFVQSCAAYCLISYLLQVKDRHNGNILLHSDGHIIHIDFGFILSISPKNLGFEQSPFKLTHEFVEVMDGTSTELWAEFNHLLLKGLMAARKHMDRIINLVEIMRSNAQLPCFKNGCSATVQNLRKRFHMNLTEQELEKKTEQLVQDSLKSLSTKLYDGYQYLTNGIL